MYDKKPFLNCIFFLLVIYFVYTQCGRKKKASDINFFSLHSFKTIFLHIYIFITACETLRKHSYLFMTINHLPETDAEMY